MYIDLVFRFFLLQILSVLTSVHICFICLFVYQFEKGVIVMLFTVVFSNLFSFIIYREHSDTCVEFLTVTKTILFSFF